MLDPGSYAVQEALEDRLDALVSGVSARVQLVIADALKRAKKENWTYADSYLRYNQDVSKINQILTDGAFTANQSIDQLFNEMAELNDQWAAGFYEAKKVTQTPAANNAAMAGILNEAKKQSERFINATFQTTVVGMLDTSGNFSNVRDYYKQSVSKAVTGMLSGSEAYSKAVKGAVSDMVNSGLRVQYASGHTRELYGAARMNVMDTYRQTLSDLRKVQGKEFGADGWEISAHSPCAPDHVDYQGLQFSTKEFEKIQSSLARPFEMWNCKHIVYPVILGISNRAYSDTDLAEMKYSSEELLSFKGIGGEDLEMTRYEASQYQRQIEQSLRKAKTEEYLFKEAGQDTSELKSAIRQRQAEYKRISADVGLTTRPERTRAYIAN